MTEEQIARNREKARERYRKNVMGVVPRSLAAAYQCRGADGRTYEIGASVNWSIAEIKARASAQFGVRIADVIGGR